MIGVYGFLSGPLASGPSRGLTKILAFGFNTPLAIRL